MVYAAPDVPDTCFEILSECAPRGRMIEINDCSPEPTAKDTSLRRTHAVSVSNPR